ncbi:hypothetical protein AB0C70_31240 [Streptomyces sp. NPDC048564]|uniref:hypothetical protein n=1 Tax=Streptomyces sp. NPDC048564 TaxID=3155760 RepID=UPI00342818D5
MRTRASSPAPGVAVTWIGLRAGTPVVTRVCFGAAGPVAVAGVRRSTTVSVEGRESASWASTAT